MCRQTAYRVRELMIDVGEMRKGNLNNSCSYWLSRIEDYCKIIRQNHVAVFIVRRIYRIRSFCDHVDANLWRTSESFHEMQGCSLTGAVTGNRRES